MPDIEIIKVVLNAGEFGLIAWVVFQTFARTLPRLDERLDRTVERLEAQLTRQQLESIELLTLQRERFDRQMSAFREMHERTINRITDAVRDREEYS